MGLRFLVFLTVYNLLDMRAHFKNKNYYVWVRSGSGPGPMGPRVWFLPYAHENGDKQRPTKKRQVQGMLDETDPLTFSL